MQIRPERQCDPSDSPHIGARLERDGVIEDPSSSQVEAIELLTLLVERYEQAHYTIPDADAVSVVRFLIQQGLTQRDLTPEFGSESAVSMFLAGQRKLTLEQVRKLSSRFKLPADVFIRKQ